MGRGLPELVIETAGLRKTFRSLTRPPRVAVDGLDLAVPRGGVHGFLGPNGAGKTTTLRLLLGLVHADAGQMRMLGEPVPARLPAVMGRIGALVESPQFFPAFSGRRNLALLAAARGLPAARVEEVLDVVELRDRAADRYRGYSLGMKQRLGVAACLLARPDLLVLDEPANGLDPAGIRDMRRLLRRVADEGATVLLSSHLLGEVQQVCDSVSILDRGRALVSGPVHQVLTGRGGAALRVGLADLDAGHRVLQAAGLAVRREPDHLRVEGVSDGAQVSALLGGQGLWVRELTALAPDLETVFLAVTGRTETAGPEAAGAEAAGPETGRTEEVVS
ncbi:MAG: ATP-binding cassette domain-containing protein [Actinomycetota bacterium]